MASAKQSTQRAKFSYVNRSDIEKFIAIGKIDANDIVYTRDTHENIFIGSDLSINPVQSKIYSFQDIKSAEDYLNKATDSYAGQLVAIETNGHYSAYIVNKNDSSFYVSLVSESVEPGDYNTLGNRPIDNLNGTLDTPIIVEFIKLLDNIKLVLMMKLHILLRMKLFSLFYRGKKYLFVKSHLTIF